MNLPNLLEQTEAVKRGHFQLSSGYHSDTYFQCAKLLEHPKNARSVAKELAKLVQGNNVDFIASPAIGGIIIGFAVAEILNVPFVFTERDASAMRLRRGFEITGGSNVLVIEDVITTGGSAKEVCKLIESLGANVAGIGAIIKRANPNLPYNIFSLLEMQTTAYPFTQCPLCKQGMPLQSPGSRRLTKKI